MKLEGRVAIVTGGSRGIGRAIARKFASEGAAVAITARSQKEVGQAASEIQNSGGRALAIAADVSSEGDCEKIAKAAHDAFGPVDILVNNAGVLGPVLPTEKVEPQEWDRVIAINLRGPFLLSRILLPEMYQRRSGSIINITSVAAKMAFQLDSAYAASKAGLAGLTRTLAAEAARKGVRVNAISPGPVGDTSMFEELGRGLSGYLQTDAEKVTTQMAGGVLQGRLQTTEEIAAAALFLASDEASAITGQTLNVDGGMAFY